MSDKIKLISHITAALVAALAIGSLALSFDALRAVAIDNGITGWRAFVWPLLVDASLVVFSLAVVRNSLRGERTAWPWLLVGVYTVATVAFNLLHAPYSLSAWGVAVVAPVSLFLSFETLMSHLKSDVRRAAVVQSLAQLSADRDTLTGDIAKLTARRDKLSADVSDLKADKKQHYAGVGDDTRSAALDILRNDPDITGTELARQIDRAPSTGRRLKRELKPIVSANGHGGAQ